MFSSVGLFYFSGWSPRLILLFVPSLVPFVLLICLPPSFYLFAPFYFFFSFSGFFLLLIFSLGCTDNSWCARPAGPRSLAGCAHAKAGDRMREMPIGWDRDASPHPPLPSLGFVSCRGFPSLWHCDGQTTWLTAKSGTWRGFLCCKRLQVRTLMGALGVSSPPSPQIQNTAGSILCNTALTKASC